MTPEERKKFREIISNLREKGYDYADIESFIDECFDDEIKKERGIG